MPNLHHSPWLKPREQDPHDYFDAIVLGIVEGLTEFPPVSSTGHLMITEKALGLPVESRAVGAYTAVLQNTHLAVARPDAGHVTDADVVHLLGHPYAAGFTAGIQVLDRSDAQAQRP